MRISIKTTSGRALMDDVERPGAVSCFADHLDVGLGVQQHAEAGPDEGLVVGQDDSDHEDTSARVGSTARTRNPPPESGRGRRACRPVRPRARACRRGRGPGVVVQHGRAEPVVGHLYLQRVGAVVEADASRGRRARRGAARWSSDSWTMRYAAASTAAGSTAEPVTTTSTGSPACRVRATSPSSRAKEGTGARVAPIRRPMREHAERHPQLVERFLARALDRDQRGRGLVRDGRRRRARPRRPGC